MPSVILQNPVHVLDDTLPNDITLPAFMVSKTRGFLPRMDPITHLPPSSPSAGFKPWMEYAGSYALFNYRLEDPMAGLEYSNLRLIRAFEHGLDPTSSEAGFVLVHVDMVKNSALPAAATQRRDFNAGLRTVLDTMRKVNRTMETMWAKSKPTSYTSFRTFIFGITSQEYRPSNHRAFLQSVKERALEVGTKTFALAVDQNDPDQEILESRALWLKVLNEVRDFRWRHWCFAREYILKRTAHPTATGGSPIVTWLPNQLEAVLDEMMAIYEEVGGKDNLDEESRDIMDLAGRQQETLRKEVNKYCSERGVSRS
ncbi:unnamed protein product [Parascedosporium putredinis]|uniref:Uncharacterized protein n=1 Tax=Parascedosporium putredinis TaxID=1442378 RepID=A0A9P1H421_9PEZI|nr:unnamed protein product [Parascedosporium putredinis]CAI7995635.1 unnamed protein product [Parascedosporium putredinis]